MTCFSGFNICPVHVQTVQLRHTGVSNALFTRMNKCWPSSSARQNSALHTLPRQENRNPPCICSFFVPGYLPPHSKKHAQNTTPFPQAYILTFKYDTAALPTALTPTPVTLLLFYVCREIKPQERGRILNKFLYSVLILHPSHTGRRMSFISPDHVYTVS